MGTPLTWEQRGEQYHLLTPDGASAGIVQQRPDAGGEHIGRFGYFAMGFDDEGIGGKAESMDEGRGLVEAHLRSRGYDVPEFTGWPEGGA